MSSCCNGPENRRIKEWGNEDKDKSSKNIKLIISVVLVVVIALAIILN